MQRTITTELFKLTQLIFVPIDVQTLNTVQCSSKIHFNILMSYDEDPGPPKQNTIQTYVTEDNTFIELNTFSVL